MSLNKLLQSWESEGREEALAAVRGVEAEARPRGSDTRVQDPSRGSDVGVRGAPRDTGVQTASRGHKIGVRGVLACSALKRDYRRLLASGFKGEDLGSNSVNSSCCVFVVLEGTKALIGERMRGREHFMPPGLLQSQLDALEPPTAQEGNTLVVVTDISAPVARITEYILAELEM